MVTPLDRAGSGSATPPSRRARFDLRDDEEIELEDYDEPSTPTFSELKRSLSLANLRELEVKKLQQAVWRPSSEPHKRPRDFEQVFAHALTGGARTYLFSNSWPFRSIIDRIRLPFHLLFSSSMHATQARCSWDSHSDQWSTSSSSHCE